MPCSDGTTEGYISLPNVASPEPQRKFIFWSGNYADLDFDGQVNFKDFAGFANNWGRTDCNSANHWCSYADLNRDGDVDKIDLKNFTEQWLCDPNTISKLTPKLNGASALEGKYLAGFQKESAEKFYKRKEAA